jgi:Ca-activated chloride channel family protein
MLRSLFAVSLCGVVLALAALPQQVSAPAKQPAEPPKQEQEKQEPPLTFTSGVTEVIVPVTATDEKGKFISNLTANDFRVTDEGRQQRISFFSHTDKQPIVVGFLIDQSSTMRIHWDKYQEAILELIWALLPGDALHTGYLISYANDAELAVNTTEDSDKLAAAVRKMKPSGGSTLNDAIYRACVDRKLVKGEPYEPRRIIIIVGDGHDNASKHSADEVLELAKRNQVTIYAISTASFGFDNPSRDSLEKLAIETGGHVEYPLNNLYKDVSGYLSHPSDDGNYALTVGVGGYAGEISAGIIKSVTGIAGEIATQYVLRYKPDVDAELTPKQFRRIKVEIPMLPNAKLSFKNGYFPFPVLQPQKSGAGSK